MDQTHRNKLVERVARIRSELELSQMDFEDARRRLETDQDRLKAALDAVGKWDSQITQTVIEGTEHMSLDPESCPTSSGHKGKQRADDMQQ